MLLWEVLQPPSDLCLRVQFKGAKPGIMGEDLRKALGMADNTPPPWLINMQRYGPPPSYPDLKVCCPASLDLPEGFTF